MVLLHISFLLQHNPVNQLAVQGFRVKNRRGVQDVQEHQFKPVCYLISSNQETAKQIFEKVLSKKSSLVCYKRW